MAEIKVTDQNIEELKSSSTPVIVDFWASWCGPCQMLGPIFEELSEEYSEDKLKFGKCSTEEYQQIASDNGVTGIPCMIVFKEGKEVDRIVGFMQKDQLKQKIDEILKKA